MYEFHFVDILANRDGAAIFWVYLSGGRSGMGLNYINAYYCICTYYNGRLRH